MKFKFVKWISILLVFSIVTFSCQGFIRYRANIKELLLLDFLDLNEEMKCMSTRLKNVSSNSDKMIYDDMYIDYIYNLESISIISDNCNYDEYNLDEFKVMLIKLDSVDALDHPQEIYDNLLTIFLSWNNFNWDKIEGGSYDFNEDNLGIKKLIKITNSLSKESLTMIKK